MSIPIQPVRGTNSDGSLPISIASGGGAVTVADGADVTQGAIADSAVTGDNTGTVSAKLRGLNKVFADIWDSTNHFFKTRILHEPLASLAWTAINVSTAGNQATATKASAGAGIRNVCTGLTIMLAGSAAPAATQITVALIDGASGGTSYLWRAVISVSAVAGAPVGLVVGNKWLVGSQATAMTLEFSVGIANLVQSVSMDGTTITE